MLCDNPISLDEIEKGLWLGEWFFPTHTFRMWLPLLISNVVSARPTIIIFIVDIYFRKFHGSHRYGNAEATQYHTHINLGYLPFACAHHRDSIPNDKIYSQFVDFELPIAHTQTDIFILAFPYSSIRHTKRWFTWTFRRMLRFYWECVSQ